MIYVIPVVLGALLKDAITPGDSGDWDDIEKIVKKVVSEEISSIFGLFVVAREFAGAGKIMAGDRSRDYSGPAGVRLVADTHTALKQVMQGEFDDAMRKAVINLSGDVFGLPSAQINRTITGAEALNEGRTDNPAALLFGVQKPN
jgi:hypothetical protein